MNRISEERLDDLEIVSGSQSYGLSLMQTKQLTNALREAYTEVDNVRWANKTNNEHIAIQKREIDRLRSEAERLRGLIKEAEYAPGQYVQEGGRCPWCLAGNLKRDGSRWPDEHPDDCPAFTPDGEVK